MTPSNRLALNTFMTSFAKTLFNEDKETDKSLNYSNFIDSYLLFTDQKQKKRAKPVSLEYIRINDVEYLWDARSNNIYDYKSREIIGQYNTDTGILCHEL